MADIIKFVVPQKIVQPKQFGMTDEEFETRIGRISATANSALEAMKISIDDGTWSREHATDLAVLSRELANLFDIAASLIAKRDAARDD